MSASRQALIVYYSQTGNTARVARDLAARLGADLENIHDSGHGMGALGHFTAAFDAWRKAPAHIGALQRDPAEYAITVIGTPVWAGQMTPAIRAYLKEASDRLQNVAFFVTSGETDAAKVAPSLEVAAGRGAVALAGFDAAALGDAAAYEGKLTAFVEEIKRASEPARSAACG